MVKGATEGLTLEELQYPCPVLNRLSISDEQKTKKPKVIGHWTWKKKAWFA